MHGTRLVLVRHGHSMAQEEGFAGGHDGCRGLSPLGRRQSDALAARLRDTGELGEVAALYSSVMPRAVETADRLADAVGAPHRRQECDLCEFHIGEEADGMPWAQIRERWPVPSDGVDEHWRRTPTTESWSEMTVRIARVLDRIVAAHLGRTVLIATHGGVVGNLMMQMLGLSTRPDVDDRAYLNTTNTSITEFVHEPMPWASTEASAWRLERYNDAAHLAGLS